jgi:hypothetical protein
MQNPPSGRGHGADEYEPAGCLTWPARVIAIIIVVPLRLLWEAVAAVGRAVYRFVLRPLGLLIYHVVVRPLNWLFTMLVVIPLRWLFRVLVVIPLSWVWRVFLTPVGRRLYAYVLVPIGRALRWVVAGLLLIILTPLVYGIDLLVRGIRALYRWARPALAAIGGVIADALAYAWDVATVVVRFLGRVLFHTVVRPVRWVWRTAIRPVFVSAGLATAWTWRVAVASPVAWARRNLL